MMSSNWNFKAAVEPTERRWRVVFNGGRNIMQFFTKVEAEVFAAQHSGTVEPITSRPLVLQRAR